MFSVEQDWKSKLASDALTMTIHLRLSNYWVNQAAQKRITKLYSQFRRMKKLVWRFRARN